MVYISQLREVVRLDFKKTEHNYVLLIRNRLQIKRNKYDISERIK